MFDLVYLTVFMRLRDFVTRSYNLFDIWNWTICCICSHCNII